MLPGRPTVSVGLAGDVPVPCAWNGEGHVVPAVWRPETGGWYTTDGVLAFLGLADDVPVPAPWHGGGECVAAVFRDDGTWPGTPHTQTFGRAGDVPVPGDWRGDGTAVRAVWRPSTGEWLIDTPTGPEVLARLGGREDQPTPADWDGDGALEPAVWRPKDGTLRQLGAPAIRVGDPGAEAAMLAPGVRQQIVSTAAPTPGGGTTDTVETSLAAGRWVVGGTAVVVALGAAALWRANRGAQTGWVSASAPRSYALLLAAAVTLPWSAARVGWAPVGDLILVGGLFGLMLELGTRAVLRSSSGQRQLVLIGGSLALAGGLLGGMAGTPGPVGFTELARAIVGVALPVVTLAAAGLSDRERRRLALAFACGCALSVVVGIPDAAAGLRMTGLATHPNHLGLACVLGVALAAGAMTTSWSRLAAVALVLNAVGVLASGSRSALLGLLVLGVWSLFGRGSERSQLRSRVVTGIAILTAIGAAVIHGVALDRAFGDPASDDGRRFQLDVTLDRIQRSPWTGEGFRFLEEAHSVPLQLLAAGGPLTLIGGGILLAAPIVYGRRQRSSPLVRWLTAGWTAFLVGSVVQNILVDRYVWFVAALLLATSSPDEEITATARRSTRTRRRLVPT